MKHKLLIAAAATALMAAPSLASAQDSGVYIKAQAGYGVFTDTDIEVAGNATNGIQGDVAGQGNLAYGLGFGYDFGHWRLELDGSQLYNDLGSLGGQPSSAAKIRSSMVMLNVLYDFSDFGDWEPYVGAGLGVAKNRMSLSAADFLNDTGTVLVSNPACVSGTAVGATTARACSINDSKKSFSWNLIAGLGYNVTDNLTWDTNYRYVDMGDFTVDGAYTTQTGPNGTAVSSTLGSDVDDMSAHVLMTGFRYRFGKPAPVAVVPVVVAPVMPPVYTCWDGSTEVTDLALCPVQMFTCWDGATEVTDLGLCPARLTCWDSVTVVTDLQLCPVRPTCGESFRQETINYDHDARQSAETRNKINQILDVGQYCNVTSISVVGHTDTSGSAAYNLKLSMDRSADAKAELERQGVRVPVSSDGKGETQLKVQTANGVRNEQNRRTEVLMTLSSVIPAMMSN